MGSVKIPLIPTLMWSGFVYLAVIVTAASTGSVAPNSSNPFLFVFRLATFTLIPDMPALFAAVLFITTTLPLLYVLFMPVVEFVGVVAAGGAANPIGGQVIAAAVLVVGLVVAALLIAFLV